MCGGAKTACMWGGDRSEAFGSAAQPRPPTRVSPSLWRAPCTSALASEQRCKVALTIDVVSELVKYLGQVILTT
jgi:hypothetical protein